MPKKAPREKFKDGFEHLSTIGRGAFGVVSIVRCKEDNVRYVMKKISFSGKSTEDRDASQEEVALLKCLVHPNVVKYHSHGTDKRHLFIVMEFCEGGDLAKAIEGQGDTPFEEEQILTWLMQMLLALDYVHSMKILHRDLKTQNVFLNKFNVAKLGDFGIAKVLDGTLQQADTVVGTPFYMSPEACQNQPYTYSSDMWAIGCILYEMCTRKHAFAASNLLGLVFQIVQGTYPPIEGYSDLMDSLVKGLLQTDPKERLTCKQIFNDKRIDVDRLASFKSKIKTRRLMKRSKVQKVPKKSATAAPDAPADTAVPSMTQAEGLPLGQRLYFNMSEPITTTALRMLFVAGEQCDRKTRSPRGVSAAAAAAIGVLSRQQKANRAAADSRPDTEHTEDVSRPTDPHSTSLKKKSAKSKGKGSPSTVSSLTHESVANIGPGLGMNPIDFMKQADQETKKVLKVGTIGNVAEDTEDFYEFYASDDEFDYSDFSDDEDTEVRTQQDHKAEQESRELMLAIRNNGETASREQASVPLAATESKVDVAGTRTGTEAVPVLHLGAQAVSRRDALIEMLGARLYDKLHGLVRSDFCSARSPDMASFAHHVPPHMIPNQIYRTLEFIVFTEEIKPK